MVQNFGFPSVLALRDGKLGSGVRAILTYHSIENGTKPICVSPKLFRNHIQAIRRGGYAAVSLRDLLKADAAAGPAVALTFDDGFSNFAEVAMPILQEHDVPATVFAVSSYVGQTNDWPGQAAGCGGRRLMSWEQLEKAVRAGFTIGGHTRTHPHLRRLSPSELTDEIAGGLDDIESRLGPCSQYFAYPYGETPAAARQIVSRLANAAVTTKFHMLTAGSHATALPRLDAFYFQDPQRLERLFSAETRRWIAWRRALRQVRDRIPL